MLGRSYPGLMWRQWNAEFRDDLRSFVKGDPGKVGALMRRLYGRSTESYILLREVLPAQLRAHRKTWLLDPLPHNGQAIGDVDESVRPPDPGCETLFLPGHP
jgi:hypothetical protein